MMDQTNNYKSSLAQKDAFNPPDPTTIFLANKKAPTLDSGHSTKVGGMWTLKHDISSPKFYELLIKIELIGGTYLDLKIFYNYIKICLNAVTRLQEDLLPS